MAMKYPDRWLDYTSIGAQVDGTPFVPLKVPLKKAFFKGRQKESFTPADVCSQLPNLGMVIDLTFTKKYYEPREFIDRNVDHQKIYTKGHEIPQRSLVNKFIDIVNRFLSDEQNSDKLIGVHCTHGLNRTGYFVCAYMILEQGRNPRDTINVFNKARSHQMERANYLNSLLSLGSTGPGHVSDGSRNVESQAARDSFLRNGRSQYHEHRNNERYPNGEGTGSWRRDISPKNSDRFYPRNHRENYRRRNYGNVDGTPTNHREYRQYDSRHQRSHHYRWSRDDLQS